MSAPESTDSQEMARATRRMVVTSPKPEELLRYLGSIESAERVLTRECRKLQGRVEPVGAEQTAWTRQELHDLRWWILRACYAPERLNRGCCHCGLRLLPTVPIHQMYCDDVCAKQARRDREAPTEGSDHA